MALNDDSMADLRRWYFDERARNDGTPSQGVASDLAEELDPIGYEAAWTGEPAGSVAPAMTPDAR